MMPRPQAVHIAGILILLRWLNCRENQKLRNFATLRQSKSKSHITHYFCAKNQDFWHNFVLLICINSHQSEGRGLCKNYSEIRGRCQHSQCPRQRLTKERL